MRILFGKKLRKLESERDSFKSAFEWHLTAQVLLESLLSDIQVGRKTLHDIELTSVLVARHYAARRELKAELCGYCGHSEDPNDICWTCWDAMS